jgi:hypothetical protein
LVNFWSIEDLNVLEENLSKIEEKKINDSTEILTFLIKTLGNKIQLRGWWRSLKSIKEINYIGKNIFLKSFTEKKTRCSATDWDNHGSQIVKNGF